MNEIRKCECGGAIRVVEDPEVDHQFECSICFDPFNECGHMLGGSLHRCAKLIPPGLDGCNDHARNVLPIRLRGEPDDSGGFYL